MSRADQAALLGSEYERWARADVRSPLWIPRRFEDVRPLRAGDVLDVLDGRRNESKLAKGTIGNMHEVRETFASTAKKRIDSYLTPEPAADEDSGAHAWQRRKSTCDCCNGHARAGGGNTLAHCVPEHHCQDEASNITFDHDTWITTITESIALPLASAGVVTPATREAAIQVLRNSSPENWASSSAEFTANGSDNDAGFFLLSRPGIWGVTETEKWDKPPSEQEKKDALERWASPGGGQLLEVTQWTSGLSDASRGGARIFLTIRNYENHLGYSVPSLRFDYSLHHCESYDVGPTTLHDVMDVDGGHFEGWLDEDRLVIKATKSVHFRATSATDQDTAILLNLLAPATTSMLMRALVYEGTVELINRSLRSPVTPRSPQDGAKVDGLGPPAPGGPGRRTRISTFPPESFARLTGAPNGAPNASSRIDVEESLLENDKEATNDD